jgi:hypothetical protein
MQASEAEFRMESYWLQWCFSIRDNSPAKQIDPKHQLEAATTISTTTVLQLLPTYSKTTPQLSV